MVGGIDVNQGSTDDGRTALMFARNNVVGMLLAAGATEKGEPPEWENPENPENPIRESGFHSQGEWENPSGLTPGES